MAVLFLFSFFFFKDSLKEAYWNIYKWNDVWDSYKKKKKKKLRVDDSCNRFPMMIMVTDEVCYTILSAFNTKFETFLL